MNQIPDLKHYRANALKSKADVEAIIHQLRCALSTWEMIKALIDEELQDDLEFQHLQLVKPLKLDRDI